MDLESYLVEQDQWYSLPEPAVFHGMDHSEESDRRLQEAKFFTTADRVLILKK